MKGEGGPKEELKRRLEVSRQSSEARVILQQSSQARVTLNFVFQVGKYFHIADKDGDGQITKAEWFKVLNDAGVPTTR